MIRYIPLEADFLIGRKVHRFEIGMSYVWAWGAHDVRFEGSHGSEYVMHLYRGYQTIVRIGYSCFCHNGLYFRASIAEHFISNVLNPPNPYSLQRNVWIPFGLSVGYSFS